MVDEIHLKPLTRARKGRQIAPQASAGYGLNYRPLPAFREAQRGHEKHSSEDRKNTPAKTKKGYVPHGCKQSEFPSGPLDAQLNLPKQA